MKRYIFLLVLAIFFNLESSNPTAFDTSFANPNGYTESNFGGATAIAIKAVKMQSDGKIVIAGSATTSGPTPYNILVARYLTDGTPDLDFNALGTPGYTLTPIPGNSIQIFGMDIEESSGNIVVAGWNNSSGAYGVVARYLPNGTLDTSFNTTGYSTSFTYTGGIILNSVVIQPNSDIVVTGWIGAQSSNNGMITARYLGTGGSAGTLDPSFGASGSVTFNYGTQENRAESVSLQSDGKIVISGWSTVTSTNQITAVRYTSAGVLDTSTANGNIPFGTNGQGSVSVSILDGSQGRAMTILPNDSIIVTGVVPGPDSPSYSNIILCKFTANGSADTSFGNGLGYVTTTLESNSSDSAIAIQDNTKILIAGTINGQGLVLRYNNDGSLDSTFNEVGYIMLSTSNSLKGIAVQADQKIVAAGLNPSSTESLTLRLLGGTIARDITSQITAYGLNADFISEFLYVDFYTQIITNATAQAATISAINTILSQYAADYVDQPNFNYLSYLYLLSDQLVLAQADLLTSYGDVGINQFFIYLNDRIAQLSNQS